MGSLGVKSGGSILEAGCGNAASHADLHAMVGPRGRILGIDPTRAFIETARSRSKQQGPARATYETGDIRALPCKDAEFDAVFCDKVLIHAGPASAALREMARLTPPGGRVGAIEWLPILRDQRDRLGSACRLQHNLPKSGCMDLRVRPTWLGISMPRVLRTYPHECFPGPHNKSGRTSVLARFYRPSNTDVPSGRAD